jgi:2-methylcitrate dehydratase PrpD
MDRDITKQLVEFAVKTKYEDIPEKVLEYSKCLTLKTVAGMLAGSVKPSGRKMSRLIGDQKGLGELRVIGSGLKTSLWGAIFLEAYFAHASELEDDRFEGGVSWDITVVPLLFPLAENLRLSGKALMESLVVGLEVHTRTCLFSAQHLGLFVIPGAVGPAVGAAKALGLSANETAAALGLAISGVPLSTVNLGTDGHFFESALMSLQGVMAAEMAKAGLKGNPDIVAYLSDYLGKEKVFPEKIVEGLGKRWELCEIQIKKYPCCMQLHRQIDLVTELRKEYNIPYEEVEIIEVHGTPAETICDRPDPADENDTQFSFQHVLAAAILDGHVSLEHMTQDAVLNPTMREARSKVKFIMHPELTSEYFKEPARVVIKTKNGRKFSRERMYPIGHPKEPLTQEQFKGLYSKLTQGILSEKEISRTAELILNLEKLENIEELADILEKKF